MDRPLKPVEFRGSSLEDLSRFPPLARQKAGYQLFRGQEGNDPESWKPMSTIGPGVREIRIRESNGAFRVIFLATFATSVYVLHCFQKKTLKTSGSDIEVARRRYQELIRELQS